MSVELPEAVILAGQMGEVLPGKVVSSYDLRDIKRMVKIGFIRSPSDFNGLVERTVIDVTSRGNTVRIRFGGEMNLIVGPEYGGVIRYLEPEMEVPKYHLRLDFSDGTRLSVRITSMGVISVLRDEKLDGSYLYSRDFLKGVSPDSEEFTFPWFRDEMRSRNQQTKPLLVGKDAILVGLSNATYQDIIYRAGIHPKRRTSDLSDGELQALYNAIVGVIGERLRLGGKARFTDLYGNIGGYVSSMGPNMKDESCPKCGSLIERLAHGGGHVFLCPECQKL